MWTWVSCASLSQEFYFGWDSYFCDKNMLKAVHQMWPGAVSWWKIKTVISLYTSFIPSFLNLIVEPAGSKSNVSMSTFRAENENFLSYSPSFFSSNANKPFFSCFLDFGLVNSHLPRVQTSTTSELENFYLTALASCHFFGTVLGVISVNKVIFSFFFAEKIQWIQVKFIRKWCIQGMWLSNGLPDILLIRSA